MDDKLNNISHQKIILHGVVTSGIGKAGTMTEIPWVKEQFINKLGINPYPGTFNIMVLNEDREKLNTIRQARGIEIIPTGANHCTGIGFPALVAGKIKGAVVIPLIPNYPPAQLEIIAPEHIKRSLAVKDGDRVEVEVFL